MALLLLPLAAFAQASIQGLVLDPSGAAIPDAVITATLDATGAVRTARTGPDGRYRLPALSIGSYTIRCEKAGFQRAEVPQVYLALNQTLEQTLQLKLASAGSTIDVREQPEALNTTAPTSGSGIGGETLDETPSQNRSYLGVVLLATGVAPAAGSNALRSKAGVRSASPDSGFTIAGMRARNNSLAIDGLDNRDETTGSGRVAVGQEAVASQWLQQIGKHFDLAPVISFGSPRPINALATTDLYRTGAYPITARPAGLDRNPFYERGVFSVDLRVTKGFEWWKDHGIFLFGIGFYNLTNRTNALRVSQYYGLDTYRGLIETLNARQVQFSFQWEF